MFFCENCNKEVVVYGVSLGAASDEQLRELELQMEKEGKLVLFNPPPFGKYHCPFCSTELKEK